ncbi:MAG: histone deacetylase [Chitinispirillaceae bacterium]|nr:histone deacetylase [Chitinispirillaceae bacterium]
MPSRTGYVYDDLFIDYELEPFHPESPLRLAALHAMVSESGLLKRLTRVPLLENDSMVRDALGTVHTPEHIANVDSRGTLRNAAFGAVAGVLAAVDAVCGATVDNAFCAIRPPGHHAHNDVDHDGPSKGEGFCFFNNMAIAARHAQRTWKMNKVLIIDWDYHHGNGTEDAFYEDPTIFYFSTHRLSAYPGTGHPQKRGRGAGTGFNLNVPLPSPDNPYGPVIDDHLLAAFDDYLLPQLREVGFVPDIVLISAGFDSREKDFLGDFSISDDGFSRLTANVVALAREQCGGRIVSMLEGGYNPDGLASAAIAHVKALLES